MGFLPGLTENLGGHGEQPLENLLPVDLPRLAVPVGGSPQQQLAGRRCLQCIRLQLLVWPTGCRPPPLLPLCEGRQVEIFERENYPPPPHWDRRAIQPNHIKFMPSSALAPM
jgi:hypothetical protein